MNDMTKPPVAATPPTKMALLPVIDTGEFAELLDSNRFAQIQRVANLFSESDLVPAIFQGKPANCAVALQMAFRMRVDPMMLMQNMYIVHGRPGIEAKLAIALMNQRGPFTGPLQWKFDGEGDGRSCTCFATHRATGEQCKQTVTWTMVKAEGWLDKSGSKWKTMPEIMFQYRSAMFLGRLYCPEVLLGLPTQDELHDVGERLVSGVTLPPAEQIRMPHAKANSGNGEAIDVSGDVDTETGEIVAQDQGKAGSTPAQSQRSGETGATFESSVGDSGEPKGAAGPADKTSAESGAGASLPIASLAQRESIINIAKRGGISVAQLDDYLIEAFAVGVDQLPMAVVNKAMQLVKTKLPSSKAA